MQAWTCWGADAGAEHWAVDPWEISLNLSVCCGMHTT